jgi:uncharacterized protein (DUF305 family)
MRGRAFRGRAHGVPPRRTATAALLPVAALAALVLGACRVTPPRPLTPAQLVARDGGIAPYTAADVAFMQGMIGHHAQAVAMAAYATPNGASSPVRVLAGRIAVAQTDEIDFMVDWLARRQQAVPPRDGSDHAGHGAHAGHGTAAPGAMPGMLSPAQLDTLARARGAAFDWYFLTYMIQHHRGAITMVDALMAERSAAHDDQVFKFVSDVVADQTTEIGRMELLLRAIPAPGAP